MVAFGFQAGGFFPGSVAVFAVVLALVLVLRLTLAQRPFAGLSAPLAVAGGGLGLFAVWTLVSNAWSDAPGRALLEYDRVLLYLLAFVLMGTLAHTAGRLRWVVRGLVLGAFAVCVVGLVTRLLPEVWPLGPDLVTDGGLSFPLTYINAMGLVAAMGLIAAFTLSSDAEEAPAVRVLAAAALPVLGTALLLTFSRGAIAAGAGGLVVAVLAARGRGLLSAVLVAVPSVGIALLAAYDAQALATGLVDAQAIAQGRDLAFVVAACTLGALVARGALLALDARLAAVAVSPIPRWAGVGAVLALVAAAVVMALALDAPAALERQYERFIRPPAASEETRDRLAEVSANGRIEMWEANLRGFEAEPLHGTGAGTYALLWDRFRPYAAQVEDGHSLYLETLGELGIVGLVLVVIPVLLILGAFAWRARGADRGAGAALLGAGAAWAVHAGIDWDWEMPAVTAWFFAAGGLALASGARAQPGERRRLPNLARVGLALGCLLLAVVPARIMVSQARLDDGRQAFAQGDCASAVDSALGSIEVLAARADPYVLLGYCDVRLGQPDLAVRAMDGAVARDPGNWETHYARALALGAAGRDPRGAARRALRLSPLEPLAREAVQSFDTDKPSAWERRALKARLPTQ